MLLVRISVSILRGEIPQYVSDDLKQSESHEYSSSDFSAA
jgi:hypothetical protein